MQERNKKIFFFYGPENKNGWRPEPIIQNIKHAINNGHGHGEILKKKR